MCGFCGTLVLRDAPRPDEHRLAVARMSEVIRRRGPDDECTWSSGDGRLHLGFRRLAVLDPSDRGRQPMVSASGRSVLVFNGEIYNFAELRRELNSGGHRFRSSGDTEVLVEALERWGVDALTRLNGMFAFAWYDLDARTLVLARDHAGIKPLYYALDRSRRGVTFASQFNALVHAPWGTGRPRPDALALYLRLHHLPAPFALFDGVTQVAPGEYVTIDATGQVRHVQWWELPRLPTPQHDGGTAAVDAVEDVLGTAVKRQLVSDVPLGVFLSGGIDSPLVAAHARQAAGGPNAFTIGVSGWGQDEGPTAKEYARQLGLDLLVRNADGDAALLALDDVIEAQHEPFGDFSILPTLMLSRFAREHVTVALSGDGGDELFFGYERPLSLLRHWSDFRWPRPLRAAAYALGKTGVMSRRSGAVLAHGPGDYYFEVNSRLKERDLRALAPDLGDKVPALSAYDFSGPVTWRNLANFSRWAEFNGQLQRGLKKVDMASMHHSLEVRVPMLDREVVDLSLAVDPATAMAGGQRKALLRTALGRCVAPESIPTRKLGFSVPLTAWLRGPLLQRARETLLDGPLYPDGVFDRAAVERYLDDHTAGRRDQKWGVWTLLSLQWWAQRHLPEAR